MKNKIELTAEQLESLRRYADHCKMRPGDAQDNWRNVPVSQEQFDRLASINQDWFVEMAGYEHDPYRYFRNTKDK